jgi:hypothetical protein
LASVLEFAEPECSGLGMVVAGILAVVDDGAAEDFAMSTVMK